MVAFVEADAVDRFASAVRSRYQATTNLQPEIYAVRAAAGAGLVQDA
jgi:galactokinase